MLVYSKIYGILTEGKLKDYVLELLIFFMSEKRLESLRNE